MIPIEELIGKAMNLLSGIDKHLSVEGVPTGHLGAPPETATTLEVKPVNLEEDLWTHLDANVKGLDP